MLNQLKHVQKLFYCSTYLILLNDTSFLLTSKQKGLAFENQLIEIDMEVGK